MFPISLSAAATRGARATAAMAGMTRMAAVEVVGVVSPLVLLEVQQRTSALNRVAVVAGVSLLTMGVMDVPMTQLPSHMCCDSQVHGEHLRIVEMPLCIQILLQPVLLPLVSQRTSHPLTKRLHRARRLEKTPHLDEPAACTFRIQARQRNQLVYVLAYAKCHLDASST